MKLGIGTYTYMWSIGFPGAKPSRPMTALGLLNKAQELGVKVVQYGPNLPLDRLPEYEMQEILNKAKEWEIELEVGTRGLEADHLRRSIALTQKMGATLLRTVPEGFAGKPLLLTDLANYLQGVLPELSATGVRLALENGRIPAQRLSEVLDSLENPSLVGVTLDTANSLAIPEGWEYVTRILARHTMCLHIKDFVVQRAWHMMGFTVEGRPAGKGQLNIPWLLYTLQAARVSPNAILELWPPQQKTMEETVAMEQAWAAESVAYLRRYIAD